MSFSADWLAQREPLDHISRSGEIAAKVAAHFAGRQSLRILDLGCGTGSNIRASIPLLPDAQEWLLVDYDAGLLAEARRLLSGNADAGTEGPLTLRRDGKTITVSFRQMDLAAGADELIRSFQPDVVVASAFFDLISPEWIARFAEACATGGAALFTVLTYDGAMHFSPPHMLDEAVTAAFNQHQRSDKGFGPAAGPEGASALGEAFCRAGYLVVAADSPWHIVPARDRLTRELLTGIAQAAAETGALSREAADAWLAFRLSAQASAGQITVGHSDIFATPQRHIPAYAKP